MNKPRMTPKRWFWVLMGVLAFWLAAGSRLGGGEHGKGFLGQRELGFGQLGKTLLMPLSRSLMWIQGKAGGVFSVGGEGVAMAELRGEYGRLRALYDRLDYNYKQLQERTASVDKIWKQQHLSADRLVGAHIVGMVSSASVETFTIDRGAEAGIAAGMPVLVDLRPAGRVLHAGQGSSTVQMITDPARRMQVAARLVREEGYENKDISKLCLLRGAGNGMLRCDSVEVMIPDPPRKGDKLLLVDNEWGALQGLPVGVVEEVTGQDLETLRYSMRIGPLARVTKSSEVLVVK